MQRKIESEILPYKPSKSASIQLTYIKVSSGCSMSFSRVVNVNFSRVWFCSIPSQSFGTKFALCCHHRLTAMLRSYERTWWNLKQPRTTHAIYCFGTEFNHHMSCKIERSQIIKIKFKSSLYLYLQITIQ